MATILDFHRQGWDLWWNNDSTMFSVFQTWVCTPKLSFYDKYQEIYMLLGYSNKQLVAMAAILNKNVSSAGIFGDFSPWY